MQVTLRKIYADFQGRHSDRKHAQALIRQLDWFYRVAEFDPKTGEALPQSLSSVLAKVQACTPKGEGPLRDRLWRIAEHSRASVERLFRAMNESPRREQALLPVHAARELDAKSFIKLANRPGRTIREKLGHRPYLQAVRRFQSVDLPENRLLKAYVSLLAELLELRGESLHEKADELLPQIQSWLRSEQALAVGRWDNLPPNNVLLSHRDYRRIWDAWRWLQSIDDDISRDASQLETRSQTMQLWETCARVWADGDHRFAETPVLFDGEGFQISPWISPPAFKETWPKIDRSVPVQSITEPVCVDLSALRPRFATATESLKSLRDTFLWQNWRSANASVDIGLFNADAVSIHPDATSISVAELFSPSGNTPELFERSARAFASRLRGVFSSDMLVWLVPDLLNDFELEVLRRNLNARFPAAEPLPRSVAAVFERIDYSKISAAGFTVVVVDSVGEQICVTKLVACIDVELKELLPETHGFYWERCPPVLIDDQRSQGTAEHGYALTSVNAQGEWRGPVWPARGQPVPRSVLNQHPHIGPHSYCIHLNDSPVAGGMCLHELQQRAGPIPLWRDQIPELSIKVMRGGMYRRFHLVSRGTTIKPLRGHIIAIPVLEAFTLAAGKPFYQFPLFKDEDGGDVGFSARLDSLAFPLKKNAACRLDLTFEYGADEPYVLVFSPLDASFSPIRATWEKTEDVIVTDAPAPEYPPPTTWTALRSMPRAGGDGTHDLLDWALRGLEKELFLRSPRRTRGTLGPWRTDRNGSRFAYIRSDDGGQFVFVHENDLWDGFPLDDGDDVSFEMQERTDGRYSARNVAPPNYVNSPPSARLSEFDSEASQRWVQNVHKRVYPPVIQVWRDGRSITDPECPVEFAQAMRTNIETLGSVLRQKGVSERVRFETRFLLACMHADGSSASIPGVQEVVRSSDWRYARLLGFALGNVSMPWQKEALSELLACRSPNTLRVFAYAIWRDCHFVEKFAVAELADILDDLAVMLEGIRPCSSPPAEDKAWIRGNWARSTVEPLELLLGLLRTRDSPDLDVRMLLQPHQRVTKGLARQIERVTELVAQADVALPSRVQINIPKPEVERRTPDLLYALRLYLTGDNGANAIHIAEVSEG